MTIQKRSMIMGVMLAAAFIIYGAARYYSSSLILYVVEQTLMQKAPPGTDPDLLHKRLHAFLSETPDRNVRMQKLLRISERLEKTQTLTPEELDILLTDDTGGLRHGPLYNKRNIFRIYWNFFLLQDV